MNKPTTGLTAHKLAEVLLSMPDLPVRFQDYEGMECQIFGIVWDTETVLLKIEHI